MRSRWHWWRGYHCHILRVVTKRLDTLMASRRATVQLPAATLIRGGAWSSRDGIDPESSWTPINGQLCQGKRRSAGWRSPLVAQWNREHVSTVRQETVHQEPWLTRDGGN